jgi:hypothetical protein
MVYTDKDYVKDGQGNFILDKDGNKQLTKKARQQTADEKRRAMRKIAFETIMKTAKQFLDSGLIETAEEAQALKQALFDMRPLRSNEPAARITVQKMLKDLFGERKAIDGGEVYQAFRKGLISTPDLRKVLTLAIKTGKPEDRLWIEYDAKNDVYNLVGVGAKAPLGWTGYTPIDEAVAQ